MLDNETKKRIDDCRDILVGKLPDPKSQIEQITIALIYKFMDDMDKEAIDLGGEAKFFSGEFEKYSWDNLFDTKVTAREMLKLYSQAIESMEKNPNIPQLFRDIFKNAYLPYRDPETLKLFLKTIGEFEYTHSEKLGDAFEYLLSVMGSQGDAGQFRTPRHIIDFLVKAVDPGKTDTILDPACGTAGFLISAFKHIKEKNDNRFTPDERKRLINNFTGYDISPDMVRLSLVNMYLHGFSEPHIYEYDTLTSEERWNETFDVILANPPFMSPKGGIRPHKRFTVQSKRSEVLFVDYIAEHLNPNGKAGIIVPEGIIFQSGKAYKELRKMLVENYLYAVVSLPAGVFNPYSGVKTSILLLDREIAKKSDKILFVKIENDGYSLGAQRTPVKGGQLEEAIALIKEYKKATNARMENISELVANNNLTHIVEKSKIAENGEYNLSGERYKEQIVINSDWPLINFEDAIEKVTYTTKIKSKDYKESGLYPIIDQSDNFIAGYWNNEKDVFHISKPVTIFGDHTRCFKYVDFDFVLGADGVKILQPIDKYNPKFFYYLLKDIKIKDLGYSRHYKELKNKKIPLPPISVQEEIVAEIESYQKIIDGAKQVVKNYKPRIDINPDWEMVELGVVCEVKSGGTPSRKEPKYWNGDIPWVGSTVCKDTYVYEAEEFITKEGLKNSSAKIFEKGTTLIALVGATIGKTGYLMFDCATNQNIAGLIPKINNLDNHYLFFACQTIYNNFLRLGSGKFRLANLSFIREQKIPLPPLEVQKQIVAKIEEEQKLVEANKKLIEIFEQKIKERIAKVWGEDKKEDDKTMNTAAEPSVEYGINRN